MYKDFFHQICPREWLQDMGKRETSQLCWWVKMGDIVSLLLGPAEVLTRGLIGLIVGLGLYALEIWLIYEIITSVPPRVKNLVDTIDEEATMRGMQYYGMRHRIYSALLQVFLPLLLIAASYLSICVFLDALRQVIPLLPWSWTP